MAPAVVFAWEMHVYAPVYVLNVDVCYEPDIYSILCVLCVPRPRLVWLDLQQAPSPSLIG